MHPATFKSDFAILDVKHGRAALERRLSTSGPVKVRVDMTLDYAHGSDDGTSVEFACTVHSVREFAR